MPRCGGRFEICSKTAPSLSISELLDATLAKPMPKTQVAGCSLSLYLVSSETLF